MAYRGGERGAAAAAWVWRGAPLRRSGSSKLEDRWRLGCRGGEEASEGGGSGADGCGRCFGRGGGGLGGLMGTDCTAAAPSRNIPRGEPSALVVGRLCALHNDGVSAPAVAPDVEGGGARGEGRAGQMPSPIRCSGGRRQRGEPAVLTAVRGRTASSSEPSEDELGAPARGEGGATGSCSRAARNTEARKPASTRALLAYLRDAGTRVSDWAGQPRFRFGVRCVRLT